MGFRNTALETLASRPPVVEGESRGPVVGLATEGSGEGDAQSAQSSQAQSVPVPVDLK